LFLHHFQPDSQSTTGQPSWPNCAGCCRGLTACTAIGARSRWPSGLAPWILTCRKAASLAALCMRSSRRHKLRCQPLSVFSWRFWRAGPLLLLRLWENQERATPFILSRFHTGAENLSSSSCRLMDGADADICPDVYPGMASIVSVSTQAARSRWRQRIGTKPCGHSWKRCARARRALSLARSIGSI
jgi:hypothetical protein